MSQYVKSVFQGPDVTVPDVWVHVVVTLVSLKQIHEQFILLADKLTFQTVLLLLLLFLIADFANYILEFLILLNECSWLFMFSFFKIVSLAATDFRKRALLPLTKGIMMGLCMVLCVWSASCCCLEAARLLLSLLLLRPLLLDNEPLALSCCQSDRQAFAPVTAASCHLGPCTERGGQRHANGRTQDKVIHTLAYWLAHCLTDWLGFVLFCLKAGLDRFSVFKNVKMHQWI